jgi:hypothetical protein
MTWAIFDDKWHTQAILEILNGSDRVATIVGGALLEETLTRTLRERLRNDKGAYSKITRPSGALGNPASKIDLLYLLKAIGEGERDAMLALCEIRNLFAHNVRMTFKWKDDERMSKALASLRLHKNITHYPHHLYKSRKSKVKIEDVRTERDLFLVHLQLSLIALMVDRCSHVPWSNAPLGERKLQKQMRKP